MIDHAKAIEAAGLGGAARMLIAGELVDAADGGTLPALDPTTGQSLGTIPLARSNDVERAVAAAREAFEGAWTKEVTAGKRAELLRRLSQLCQERSKALAKVEALDVGMPVSVARKLSAGALVKNLDYYAGWADKLYGEVVPLGHRGALDFTVREPMGVVVAIIPWNTPLLFVGSKLGPALAAGCTVILKPSERASLSALEVAKLVAEAGFPPGVVQIVTGDGETGRLLASHPGIDKVCFTGGGAIAKHVLGAAAHSLTPVSTELGGKSPNIVFDDADLDRLVFPSLLGVFGLTGQACAAGTRLLVQRNIHDEVVQRLCESAPALMVGDPLDPSAMLGPLIAKESRARVEAMVAEAVKDGATLALEAPLPDGVPADGAFVAPRILTNVTPAMRVWREEVFGPVLSVTAFDDEEEAVRLANDSSYGLGAGVWTNNTARALRMAQSLVAGNVWVNSYGTLPPQAPFGGAKQSGWGRDGGRDALAEYTRVKNVFVDLGT